MNKGENIATKWSPLNSAGQVDLVAKSSLKNKKYQ